MAMRYLVNSFHLILVLFLTACAQQASEEYVLPDFPRNSSADLAIISNDVYYNVIHDIYSYHNYIIVIANDVASGKYVHIYRVFKRVEHLDNVFCNRSLTAIAFICAVAGDKAEGKD